MSQSSPNVDILEPALVGQNVTFSFHYNESDVKMVTWYFVLKNSKMCSIDENRNYPDCPHMNISRYAFRQEGDTFYMVIIAAEKRDELTYSAAIADQDSTIFTNSTRLILQGNVI